MAGWRFFLNDIEVEEPLGWDAIEFTAQRTENYGVDQPFSTDVQFYDKGAKILKAAFEQSFVSASVTFTIQSDQIVNGQPYQYNGVVDFSTYTEINTCDTDSYAISVSILQDNFRDKFKARYDVEIDLFAFDDLDGVNIGSGADLFPTIRMHGQRLFLTANGGSLAATTVGIGKSQCEWYPQDYRRILPIYWENSDLQGGFGSTIDVQGLTWSNTNVIFQDNSPATTQRTLIFSWSQFNFGINFNSVNQNWVDICDCDPYDFTSAIDIWVEKYDSNGNSQGRDRIYASPICNWFGGYNLVVPAGSQSITIQNNWRIAVYWSWAEDRGTITAPDTANGIYDSCNCCAYFGATLFIQNNIKVTLTEENVSYASQCECIPIERFLKRIIHQITGQADGFKSDCFSEASGGVYANNCITSGLLLRRFIPKGGGYSQMKTSFKSAIESLSAIFNVGWGFEWDGTKWLIRVEPFEYFYVNTIQIDATNVKELKQYPADTHFATQLKFGYESNWKNMALGGTDAIGTDRSYFVYNKAIAAGTTKTVTKQSKIIGEGIAIEYSRRLQFYDDNAGSSDRPNDYNLFIIWTVNLDHITSGVLNPEYQFENADPNSIINLIKYRASWSGCLYNLASDALCRYNLFHTGTRLALRQWQYFGMNTYKVASPLWRFQTGEYRTNFQSRISPLQLGCVEITTLNGNDWLLTENENIRTDIIKSEFQQYLLKPIIFEFDYPQSFCDFIQLAQYQPYRKVRVQMGNTVISGWILEIQNKPEDDSGGTTSFKIIASNLPDEVAVGAYDGSWSEAYY